MSRKGSTGKEAVKSSLIRVSLVLAGIQAPMIGSLRSPGCFYL
jgi:hypothetical protein